MPWKNADAMTERRQFVADYHEGIYSMTELCSRFSIPRKTGYKWIARFEECGAPGLVDRSRAPHSCPHKTSPLVESLLCEARRQHMTWGPEKLVAWLRPKHQDVLWPGPSTISALFLRENLVKSRRRRRHYEHPGAVPPVAHGPNDLWTADFKGQFKTRDGRNCYPLTICDLFSRQLLVCKGLLSTRLDEVQLAFERAFYEFGLPLAIRTDNGPPFATTAMHGLSQLNVWWMRLGIQHQRSRPAHPQDNGAHERMHRTMKAEACRPPRAHCAAQQRIFNWFRREYNEERPHAGIDNATPASRYQPSPRTYTGKLPPLEYPASLLVKRVTNAGTIRFHNRLVFISCALVNQQIALDEVDNGIWNVYFNNFLLAKLPETDYILRP